MLRARARRGLLRRRYPGVLVQIVSPSGALLERLPGIRCDGCGDVVLAGLGVERGRCARCRAREARS
jgi:hypothetical protein